MAQYRKKPVIIEAFKWTGDPDQIEDPIWSIDAIKAKKIWFQNNKMIIATLEGDMKADEGDFIIKGIKGEIYPCKPDIFALTYDPVE